ncbi:MAG: thrombospondin type 3 repeat-containing protein [Planctomycetota bacterium]
MLPVLVAGVDTDGDGVVDSIDNCVSIPNAGQENADGDAAGDACDDCPNDPLKIAPGQCGCGVADTDTDGDGTADCNDGCPNDPLKIAPGQCGCGIADTDTDGDGTADCNDGCPNDPLKIAPGTCGCGTSDEDPDGDGFPSCVDFCPNDPSKQFPGVCGCGIPDLDPDADTIMSCADNCPNASNTSQTDSDLDLIGDACDNCPFNVNPDQDDCDADGIGNLCAMVQGTPDCNRNGIPDDCDVEFGQSTDLNGNQVPDECETEGGTSYCFGNTGCPCGNNSPVGWQAGCLNSFGVAMKLVGTGTTSVSADDFVLNVVGLSSATFVKYFQTTGAQNAPFGDGRLCLGGILVRLGDRFTALNGTSVYPQGADLPVSVKGQVPPAGGSRYYQVWYRNQVSFCTPEGFNTSNGLSVVWVP